MTCLAPGQLGRFDEGDPFDEPLLEQLTRQVLVTAPDRIPALEGQQTQVAGDRIAHVAGRCDPDGVTGGRSAGEPQDRGVSPRRPPQHTVECLDEHDSRQHEWVLVEPPAAAHD